jgi:8-oxo-dGTP pyrophosphatase MutT (NUDIX family)
MPAQIMLPRYSCGIITDARGWFLLQLRPPTARVAANACTCFGGARHDHETAERCLQRELREELRWQPTHFSFACALWRADDYIAAFYHCPMLHSHDVQTEPDHIAVWAPAVCLPALPLSPWHDAVLRAFIAGKNRVSL